MSINLRLICNTCKVINTVNGRRDILSTQFHEKPPHPAALHQIVLMLESVFAAEEVKDLTSTLEAVAAWLVKHRSHDVRVTNDYGMDFFDGDDYTMEESGKTWFEYMYGYYGGPAKQQGG